MDLASRMLLFADVVEAGSFTRAADIRQVNRSVISRQIGNLESELQMRLFNRSTRSLSLTGVGRAIYERSLKLREVLKDTDELAEAYQSAPMGIIRITSPTHFGRAYVEQAVRLFLERFEQTRVELHLDDRVTDLIAGGYDLAIRMATLADSSLIARPLARNRRLICASPAYLERHGQPTSTEDLQRLPAAVYARDSLILNSVRYYNDQGEIERIPLTPRFTANDPQVVYQSVLDGSCLGIISSFVVENDIAEGRVIPLLTNLPLVNDADIKLVYPHRTYMAQKTVRFIDCLQEVVGTPPVWERLIPDFATMYGGPR